MLVVARLHALRLRLRPTAAAMVAGELSVALSFGSILSVAVCIASYYPLYAIIPTVDGNCSLTFANTSPP